ncbi:tripartite tricarboxylate transporter TctB family protein [Microvirga massiliensis]|uniref:tripartite tricarboxylate transporter TctB family protein n=1 Tax=Microvirga massiliensis TaxID=1033741 RepID=UPI00062B46BA|nr:tripartite tricarboxylate transporter TctB family protein [Microvirga massiliensis]
MQYVIPLVAVTFGAVFFVQSFSFPHLMADPGGPALFPRIVAAGAVIGGMALLVQAFLQRAPAIARAGVRSEFRWRERSSEIAIFLLVLILPIGVNYLGFNAYLFIFMAIGLRISGIGTSKSIIISALSTVGIYVAYSKVLGAILPSGILFS